MEFLLLLYLFLIGLIMGSFYNVVGLRVPNNQSIVRPRSYCTNCRTTLTATELIPVFSYVLQRGKCRTCGTRISPFYPIFELVTAILFAISPLITGLSKELVVALALISLLVIIFVSDLTYMIIPNKVLMVFLPIFIALRIWSPLEPWHASITGAVFGFLLLLVIAVISKGGMGGGDIKLFGVLGVILGIKGVLVTFILATFLGALFGLTGLLLGKIKRGEPFPFGPYIALGALLSFYFGNTIIEWYLSFY